MSKCFADFFPPLLPFRTIYEISTLIRSLDKAKKNKYTEATGCVKSYRQVWDGPIVLVHRGREPPGGNTVDNGIIQEMT